MSTATKRCVEALERRKKSTSYLGGLDHFYSMSEADRKRMLGPMYGELTDAKP